MSTSHPLSFGIKTVPAHVAYEDLLEVWREADGIPDIAHAWLWDHFLPLFGSAAGPIYEGWTLLAALAARTERLRLGLMVTSNRVRPPAVLAKIAATVDVISNGRLEFGIGVGATDAPDRAGQELAVREYEAYGLPLVPQAEGVTALAESCTIVRRLWTGDDFDFEGRCYRLIGARGEPKPVQRPHPPIVIGGWGARTLRVVVEHADIWNMPGPPHNEVARVAERNALLDRCCAAIERDPRTIARSTQIVVSYENPQETRSILLSLVAEGVSHLVLGLPRPYRPHVARWVTDEIIVPVREDACG